MEASTLIRVLIPYFLLTFLLAPAFWETSVREKKHRSPWLYLEALGFALLSYVFWGKWEAWPALLVWVLGSLFLRLLLGRQREGWSEGSRLLIDGVGHLMLVGGVLLLWESGGASWEAHWQLFQPSQTFWIIGFAYFLIWKPAGQVMKLLTQPFFEQIEDKAQGLRDAGRWIGILERTLVLTFILLNQLTAVGFLITAKSILRFGEIKEHKQRQEAEYILIGTLGSFLIAIFVGLGARALLG